MGHSPDDCKYKDAHCHKCSTGGKHAGSQHAQVNIVEDVYDNDAEKYVTVLEIHSMDKPDTRIIWLNSKTNVTPL